MKASPARRVLIYFIGLAATLALWVTTAGALTCLLTPSSPVISGLAGACWSRWPSCPDARSRQRILLAGSADAGIAVRFPPSRRCAIAASGAGEQAGGGPGSAARARAGKPPVTSDRRTSSASLPCAVPKLIHGEQSMIIV